MLIVVVTLPDEHPLLDKDHEKLILLEDKEILCSHSLMMDSDYLKTFVYLRSSFGQRFVSRDHTRDTDDTRFYELYFPAYCTLQLPHFELC